MITCLAYSPDGRLLASGSQDTTALLWNLRAHSSGQAAGKSRSPEELWSELAAPRAERAYQAILELADAPQQAVPLLKARLLAERGKAPAAEHIPKLVTDLDSPQFAVRERATRRLEQLGDRAETALLAALKREPSPELRRRIEGLLSRIQGTPSPEELRDLRAVEVLEMVGNEGARQVLAELTRGVPETRLADQARAACARLAQRRGD